MGKRESGKLPDASRKRSRGRFVRGCSGNPAGRPRGIKDKRVALRSLMEPAKERLIHKAVTLALSGDTAALKLCIERLVPVLKATSEPIATGVPIADTTPALQARAIFERVASGQIAAEDGEKLMSLLVNQSKVFEAAELRQKVNDLEMLVHRRNSH